jgi:hypothetical protein
MATASYTRLPKHHRLNSLASPAYFSSAQEAALFDVASKNPSLDATIRRLTVRVNSALDLILTHLTPVAYVRRLKYHERKVN